MEVRLVNIKPIAKRNREFAKLNKAQKRVAVAKDVLSLLRRGKIVPEHMVYETLHGDTCRVCAIGAAMVSAIGSGTGEDPYCSRELGRIFTDRQLQAMERTFEDSKYVDRGEWGAEYVNDLTAAARDSLKGIMTQVVRLGGKFSRLDKAGNLK